MTMMTKEEAVERLWALKELTATTGVQTYKTQNALLAALTPEVLVEVALEIKRYTAAEQILSGKNLKGTDNANHNTAPVR